MLIVRTILDSYSLDDLDDAVFELHYTSDFAKEKRDRNPNRRLYDEFHWWRNLSALSVGVKHYKQYKWLSKVPSDC